MAESTITPRYDSRPGEGQTPGSDDAAILTTSGSATEMIVDGTSVDTREVQRMLLRLGGNGF